MKKRILSSLLMGALFVASMSTFTSCKDYDDDINDLRSQISTNATDLTSLVNQKISNAESEISALKTAQSNLEAAYKQADTDLSAAIKKATNDAEGYADIQAAAAQKAAIAASQKAIDDAVASLQSKLDAANATIDAQGKTISSLLDADKVLTEGISAAKADAQKAYDLANTANTLANQANTTAEANKSDIAKITSDIKTINETLGTIQDKMTIMSDNIDKVVKEAAANKAAIAANKAAIADLKSSDSTALANLAATDNALRELITANKDDITKLNTVTVPELKQLIESNAKIASDAIDAIKTDLANNYWTGDSIAKYIGANNKTLYKAIEDAANNSLASANHYADSIVGAAKVQILQEAGASVDIKIANVTSAYQRQDSLLNDSIAKVAINVAGNKTAIEGLNKAVVTINDRLTALENSLNALVTGVIIQGTSQEPTSLEQYDFTARYGVSTAAETFPYKDAPGAMSSTANQKLYESYCGDLYLTINPTSIDFTNSVDFKLVNSLDEENKNFSAGNPTAAEGVKITRSASKNGLYAVPVTFNGTSFTNDDDAAYGVAVSYKSYKWNASTQKTDTVVNKVYSQYKLGLNAEKYEETNKATDLSLTAINYDKDKNKVTNTLSTTNTTIGYTGTKLELGSEYNAYKKYIECTSAVPTGQTTSDAALVAKMNKNGNFKTIITPDAKSDVDDVTVAEDDANNGVTYTYKYYVWNYDGSIVNGEYVITYSKPLLDDVTVNVTTSPTATTGNVSTYAQGSEFTGCALIANKTWTSNTTKIKATLPGNSEVSALNLVSYDEKTKTPTTVISLGAGDNTVTAAELANVGGLTISYNASKVKVDSVYAIKLVCYGEKGNVVNTVNVNFKVVMPTSHNEDMIRPIQSAFNSDYSETIAWAQVSDDTHAYFVMSSSFLGLETNADKTVSIFDVTEPKDAKYQGYTAPTTDKFKMIVPNKAVEDEFSYAMTGTINYFGLTNFAHQLHGFNLKWESPIYHDGLKINDQTVYYNGDAVVVGPSEFIAQDPSIAKATPVYYFTGNVTINNAPVSVTRDLRIKSITIAVKDSKDTNNGLFDSYKVEADGIHLLAKGNVAMQSEPTVTFVVSITDAFGKVQTAEMNVTVKKNTSGAKRH